jgi:hypothetical protein
MSIKCLLKSTLADVLRTLNRQINKGLRSVLKEEDLIFYYDIEEKRRSATETIVENNTHRTVTRVKECAIYLADDLEKKRIGVFQSHSVMTKKKSEETYLVTTTKNIVLETVPDIEQDTTLIGHLSYRTSGLVPDTLPVTYYAHSINKTFQYKNISVTLDTEDGKIGIMTIRIDDDLRKLL